MSKTACGEGKSYCVRLSYSPVPGLRKSGIPHARHIRNLKCTGCYEMKIKNKHTPHF